MQKLAEAEECFRQAIEVYKELHAESGASMLTKEALGAFYELQKMFISQGKPNLSEKILTEEVEPLTTHDFDDITFFWHLTHVAYIYVEYDYTQYAKAAWRRVFETYEEKHDQLIEQTAKRSPFEERVVSIITNSRNEFALMQLNQGRVEAAQKVFEDIDQKAYTLQTTSKYFDTILSNFLISADERDFVCGIFVIELRVRNPRIIFPNSLIRLRVELNGQTVDQKEIEYDGSRSSLLLRGNSLSTLEEGSYILFVEVVDEMSEETYQHRQSLKTQFSFQPGTPMDSFIEMLQSQSRS